MRQLITLMFTFLVTVLSAQTDTLPEKVLIPVTVRASRLEFERDKLPFAISVLEKNRLQGLQQQLSVFDALTTVAGVFVQNPDNFAQDLRISIRGFGARSAFGIRGIRIITDGIPESTPDGQADVDNLDVGALDRMEILKGGASALYGNASGGVIYLQTEQPPDTPFVEMQALRGNYGFERYQAKTGFKRGRLGSFLSAGYNRQQGYRQQQSMQQLILNNKWHLQLRPKTLVTLLLNYANSPEAGDPGGLTAAQVEADRRQARMQNIQFNAGEQMEQGRAGFILEQRIDARQRLTVRGFFTARRFSNRLAFQNGGTVNIGRLFGGAGVQYSLDTRLFQRNYRSQFGLDIDALRDHRQRFQNNDGIKGDQTLDQDEKFSSAGIYWVQHYAFSSRWQLTTGLRLDRVNLAAEDFFLSDGDQSGAIPQTRFSPSAGLAFKLSRFVHLYVNSSSNFETPTLNELSANPDQTGGFNQALKPQKAWNNEIGAKTTLFKTLHLEAALFFIALKNEFVPYQLADFPGRTFYKNAGTSQRKGLEFGLNWQAGVRCSFNVNYSCSDFRYTRYLSNQEDFSKNHIPGVPVHQGSAGWQWQGRQGFSAMVQLRYTGRFYTNDANTVQNGAYTLLHVKAGYRLRFRNCSLEPFGGVQNVLNTLYNANVLINGAGDRFFEPAAGISAYGGLKLRLGK